VDCNTLNDQITSSSDQTDWHDNVEQDVLQRDGFCVVTGLCAEDCDAAYIIPKCKGDEVVMFMTTLMLLLNVNPF
jgi:hypothetical protein